MEGPQASTRNVKDRRPALQCPASRSLATALNAIESRLLALEGKTSPTSPTSPSFKSTAPVDLDLILVKWGEAHNNVDDRTADLEVDQKETSARLKDLERRIEPYDAYQQRALDAVKTLKTFKNQIAAAKSFEKGDDRMARLINEHEASIREQSARLLRVEDQAELAKAQNLSTNNLARALVQRLERGDVLQVEVCRDLHFVIPDLVPAPRVVVPPPPTRFPETPVTEEAEESQQGPATSSSSKKKRGRDDPERQKTTKKRRSERLTTEAADTAPLQAFKEGGLKETPAPGGEEGGKGEKGGGGSERRSGRKPQPTKRSGEMMPWKQANSRIKGLR